MIKKLTLLSLSLFVQATFIFSYCQTWETCSSLPEAMVPSAIAVKGKIYAVRSSDFYRGNLSEPSFMYEYDPQNDTWTKRGQMNYIRTYYGTISLNNRIYVLGGVMKNGRSTPVVEEFDAATGMWTPKKEMPLPLRGMALVAMNGRIISVGGSVRKLNGKIPRDSTVNSVFEYTPKSNSWRELKPMNASRTFHACVLHKNRIYAIGGHDGNSRKGVNTIEEYDPKTNSWRTLCTLIIPFDGQCQALGLDNVIYTFSSDLDQNMKFTRALIGSFDPSTGKWEEKTNLISQVMDMGVVAARSNIYLIGGHGVTGGNSDKVIEYDPRTNKQVFLPPITKWMNGLTVLNNSIYAVGGIDSKAGFLGSVIKLSVK